MKQRVTFAITIALTLAIILGVASRSRAKEAGKLPNATAANVSPATGQSASAAPARVESNPEREAYFGETHVHTSWSFDAYVFGNMKAGPEDAYRYAIGQPIDHPAGYKVKITRPLDFMAVTDHAEY